MRKKFLTLFLSVFMVLPIVGCGEKGMNETPDAEELKIVLHYAELQEGTGNYQTDVNQFTIDYTTCADISGGGFYEIGEGANLIADTNRACEFMEWVTPGNTAGSYNRIGSAGKKNVIYTVKEADGGKTMDVYAVFKLSGTGGSIGENSYTKLGFSGISIISYEGTSKKISDLDDAALAQYHFVSGGKSFADLKTAINNQEFEKGKKLSEIFPDTNLNYFLDPSNALQNYKINWAYGTPTSGSCSTFTPTTAFDPMKDTLAMNNNLCIGANIDLSVDVSGDYIKEAITSTFYNQAYIDTVSNSSCMSATKANTTITSTCMFVKNIGGITGVTEMPGLGLANKNIMYNALTTDTFGGQRIEGIETYFNALTYISYSYNDGTNNAYYMDIENVNEQTLDQFGTKLEPLYKTMKEALANPTTKKHLLTFTHSKLTDTIVLKSVNVNGTIYYFNYVEDASGVGAYVPEGAGSHTLRTVNRMKVAPYSLTLNGNVADADLFETLEEKINSIPQNMMGGTAIEMKNKLQKLIFALVNDSSQGLRALRKYAFTIVTDEDAKTAVVTVENKLLTPAQMNAMKYAYDNNGTVSVLDYASENKFNTSAYSYSADMETLLERLNSIMTLDELVAANDWLTITVTGSYVEYSFYNGAASDELLYKIRYYTGASPKVEVINTTNDRFVDKTFTFIKNTETDNLDSILTIEQGSTSLATTTTYVINKTNDILSSGIYTLTISGEHYIIDLLNKKLFNLDTKETISIVSNLASELKYYFVIEEQYYGIYLSGSDLDVYTVEVNETEQTVTKSDSALLRLVPGRAVILDGFYFLVVVETDPAEKYTLKFFDEDIELSFDGDVATVVITDIIVKEGDVRVEPDGTEVYAFYEFLNAHVDEIEHILLNLVTGQEDGYLFVYGGQIYELIQDSSYANVFTMEYDGDVYTITFSLVS